jgi:hypothetical protein
MRKSVQSWTVRMKYTFAGGSTKLNMDLEISKDYLGSSVQLYLLAEIPQLSPSPSIWAHHLRGRYWSAEIDDISLLVTPW